MKYKAAKIFSGEEEDNGCSEKKADHKGRQAAGI